MMNRGSVWVLVLVLLATFFTTGIPSAIAAHDTTLHTMYVKDNTCACTFFPQYEVSQYSDCVYDASSDKMFIDNHRVAGVIKNYLLYPFSQAVVFTSGSFKVDSTTVASYTQSNLQHYDFFWDPNDMRWYGGKARLTMWLNKSATGTKQDSTMWHSSGTFPPTYSHTDTLTIYSDGTCQ